MKLVTRILTSRLQPFVERLVAFEQSGFVKGRNITDNFLYATDLVQSCHVRKVSAVVLKLDFRKAFDSVNWEALDAVLESRGFGSVFRGWISAALSSGRTAILLNGVPGRWIQCKKGLRQGDPISPYLFLILGELLHLMVVGGAGGDRLLHPLDDDLPCPVVQYADDTLLILRADRGQLTLLRDILDSFSLATGLEINYHKSTFVPIQVAPDRAAELASVLGCPTASFPQTYLGLPLSDSKLPASALEYLATTVSNRIPSWRTSLIPIGGRVTLASSVLSALPMFAMSVLPLSKGTLTKIDRPRRALVWAAAAECSGGDCQVAWDFVCRLRSEGGLGVVDLELQNKCLLLKMVHSLFSGRDTPWTRWVRRSYFGPDPAPATPSWRRFQSLIPLYRSITTVVLGDGATTSLWHDSWTALGALAFALPAAYSHCCDPDATIEVALREGEPRVPLQPRVSEQAAAEMTFLRASLRRLTLKGSHDARSVSVGGSSSFQTSEVYRALHSSGCVVPLQEANWDCFAPPKVRIFFWILRHRKTRTRAHLFRLGIAPNPHCPFCPGCHEDLPHLFYGCPRLVPLWARLSPSFRPVGDDVVRLFGDLSAGLPPMHATVVNTVSLAVLWSIWKARNRKVFEGELLSTTRILAMVADHLQLWTCRAPRRLPLDDLRAWCDTVLR